MRRVAVTVIREPAVTASTERKRAVCWDFGIPQREPPTVIAEGLEIELRAGQIVLVTGPSGSGKSSVLAAIAQQIEGCAVVGRGRFRRGRAIVESIAPRRPLAAALEILTACGLGEPRLWVRQFGDLSDGERFRAELARAIGEVMNEGADRPRSTSDTGGQAACGTPSDGATGGCCTLTPAPGHRPKPTSRAGLSLRGRGSGDAHRLETGATSKEHRLIAGATQRNHRLETGATRSEPAEGGRAPEADGGCAHMITAEGPPKADATALRVIVCDEFGAGLHRRLVEAMACNLRKLVTRRGLTLVVASTSEDVGRELRPDRIVRLGGGTVGTVVRRERPHSRGPSIRARLCVRPGAVKDYRLFKAMHYRQRDGLGFVDKVFVLREKAAGDALGIVVFAHAPLELAMRNAATGGRFVRNPRRLNRELRILRRLVIHPDVRGCGLGHWFVRRALPEAGVRFVECLAAMGEINPVFEKAGMARMGQCPLPRGRFALLRRLRAWGLDPFAPEFDRQVARRPRVRRLVEATIRDWAGRTQSDAQYETTGRRPAELTRAFRQIIGRPPVYYLWDREGEFPRQAGRGRSDPNERGGRGDARRRREDVDAGQESREGARHDPGSA